MAEAKQREDQRIRVTRTLLQNAFLSLLAQKPVQTVTVKELCQRAGVNRGTFYLRYRDVYHLLEEMENALLADLDTLLAQTPVIAKAPCASRRGVFIRAFYDFFEKNREMCAVLLSDNGDKKFVAGIIERARQKSVKEYQLLFPNASRRQVELFYCFVAHGFIGLIQQRLDRRDGPAFQEIAAGAESIIICASRAFEEQDAAWQDRTREI